MNTFEVFEQFRGPFGEEPARALAHTLGAMFEELKNTGTKEDFQGLEASLDTNVSRLESAIVRLAEAQARTEVRVDSLATAVERLTDAQTRTDARVDSLTTAVERLTDAQARTDARVDSLTTAVERLTDAQARTDARVDSLATAVERLTDAQTRTEASLRELTEIVTGLAIRSDRHEGTLLELKFRDRLPSYLGLYLRKARVLQPAYLLDQIERQLTREEVEDFLRIDVLAHGAVEGRPTYVVGEVSYTADANDVERAARRAGVLRKADLPAIGLVACESVHPQTIAYAREQGVRIWADGRLLAETPAAAG